MKTGAHTQWECKYHLILNPKYRKDIFKDQQIKEYAWNLLNEIAVEYEAEIEAMEISEEHVHMLIEIPPKIAVSRFIGILKSISGRELFKRFPGIKKRLWAGEFWKDGYMVKSVGSEITKESVIRYIAGHKKKAGGPAQLKLE